ncbi:MAG: DUF3096 domain-containing protein [Phycisphaerae bacterium]
MHNQWNLGELGGLWLAPALFGLVLILFGVLIFVFPDLLSFIVAAVLIFAGFSLLGLAWNMRVRVTYRRKGDRGSGLDERDDL